MVSATETRKQIFSKILAMTENNGSVDLEQITSNLALSTGWRKQTIIGIVKEMQVSGYVKVEDGRIVPKGVEQ